MAESRRHVSRQETITMQRLPLFAERLRVSGPHQASEGGQPLVAMQLQSCFAVPLLRERLGGRGVGTALL